MNTNDKIQLALRYYQSGNLSAYLNIAWDLQRQGHKEEALTCYLKAMEFTPDSWQIKRKKLAILLTGTGRCGTGYMAKLLTSAGLSCEHEKIFNVIININNLVNNENIGESSWLAVPYLNASYFNETTIIHTVRNPLDTIQSFMKINFFVDKNLYYLYAERLLPELKTLHPDKASFFFFMEWTKMILKYENNKNYLRFKIEDNPVSLVEKLGGDASNLFSDTTFNTRNQDKLQPQITVEEIPVEYRTEFIEISEQIGYKLI